MIPALFILLFLPSVCLAQEWDRTDRLLFFALEMTFAADILSTNHCQEHHNGTEKNPCSNDHPSPLRLGYYYAGGSLLYFLIADYLPPRWRKAFLSVATMTHLTFAAHNEFCVKWGF